VSSLPTPRNLAYAGLFGAAALLLPVLFHLVHLGHVFMPMYLPLLALAFLVRPAPAAITAAVTPLLSAAVTGMPPFYPPVAIFMAIELSAMAGLIATVLAWWPRANTWLLLALALAVGRALFVGLTYGFSLVVHLPAGFLAGVSFLGAWPGLVLILLTVPPVVRVVRRTGKPPIHPSKEQQS
jgi:hypothetical protein